MGLRSDMRIRADQCGIHELRCVGCLIIPKPCEILTNPRSSVNWMQTGIAKSVIE